MQYLGLVGLTFEDAGPRNFYMHRLYHDGISICYDGVNENMGVCVDMSGQGCRVFESFGTGNFDGIFQLVRSQPDNFTVSRIDIAFDDQEGLMDIEELADDTLREQYVSKFRTAIVEYGVPRETEGTTIYLGSKKSDFFIRIYDKAKERGFTDGRHWIRIEAQLRHKHAIGAVTNSLTLRDTLLGILRTYIRYVEDPGIDGNKWRWPTKASWDRFLDGATAVYLLDKPGVEYNLSNLEQFVVQQAGNAIDAYVAICGRDGLFNALQNRRVTPNPKYRALVDRCKGELLDVTRNLAPADVIGDAAGKE